MDLWLCDCSADATTAVKGEEVTVAEDVVWEGEEEEEEEDVPAGRM